MFRRMRGVGGGVRLSVVQVVVCLTVMLLSLLLLRATSNTMSGYTAMVDDTDLYIRAQQSAADMQHASDYLTRMARVFTVNKNRKSVDLFFEEVNTTRRRDHAVAALQEMFPDDEALSYMEQALDASRRLMLTEYRAMRLMLDVYGYDPADFPEELSSCELSAQERLMSPEEKQRLAQRLVFDDDYQALKDKINDSIAKCTESLISITYAHQAASTSALLGLLQRQRALIGLFLLTVIAFIAGVFLLMLRPLKKSVLRVREGKQMPVAGAYEMRYLAWEYNRMFSLQQESREQLSYEATHDALTGLYNRKAYENAMMTCGQSNVALLLIDIDHFKEINDTFGHAVGDDVLRLVAGTLAESFRSGDYVCRIGGDEFAVIMIKATSSLAGLVEERLRRIQQRLRENTALPPVTLSIGVAFGDRQSPQGDLFHDADLALYRAKDAGRNGWHIF